ACAIPDRLEKLCIRNPYAIRSGVLFRRFSTLRISFLTRLTSLIYNFKPQRHKAMRLAELGWSPYFEEQLDRHAGIPARVSEENRGCYRVLSEKGAFLAYVPGRIRFQASGRSDFPAVGDWITIEPWPSGERATITGILSRRTILSRKAAGRVTEQQILAANLD